MLAAKCGYPSWALVQVNDLVVRNDRLLSQFFGDESTNGRFMTAFVGMLARL